jgi:uncharacterized protein YdcH (DUF465 family)
MQTVEEKISQVIEKVRSLKEEKNSVDKRNLELEETIRAKDLEIERMAAEKVAVKQQIEDLLRELESFELK